MISIITPVWNRGDLTAQYLYSHNIHYPNDPDVEWIIIDNGSTDGTGGILEYWKDIIGSPTLQVIQNKENVGFSKANNQGAKLATGDTLIFLNNDIIIKGDYITVVDRALGDYPASVVGPQLIEYDTGWNIFNGRPIPYLMGWCLAMSRGMFDTLGGFDERYSPAYYEDIDLCYNASKKSYELREVFLPIQHLGEQTGRQLEGRRQLTEANRVKFAEKWGLRL
jgi:GT2 family glycosyltransferase